MRHVTNALQTPGTGGIRMLRNDRQRVAGRDWKTVWAYTPAFEFRSQFDCPSTVQISSWTFHEFHSGFGPDRMLLSGWWRVERNCEKVQYVNILTCLNVVVCLEHEVQVSVYGCEGSSSLCSYLQLQTFETFGGCCVPQSNWCWNPYSDNSLQSAARTGFEWSTVHYRYVCTF
jgi:hypothetical protein